MARVAVVIPTWNGAALLRAALASLAAQTFRDIETVVVDNGSTDDTLALVSREFPAVRVVRLEQNRGFAAAVNAGIRASDSELVVLMNNDVEAAPEWIAALVDALDRHDDVGACASRMLMYADRKRIDSAGDRLGLFAYSIGHGESDGPEFDEPRYVLSPCAGAAAYRRSALEQVGLFDERFFAYLEDVDLGVRMQLAGWRCLYVPAAVVYHHGSATSRRMPALKLYLLMRNSLFLFFQYMPRRRLLAWAPAMLAWPFYRVLRDRQSPAVAFRAVRDFVRAAPAVRARRAEVRRSGRIPAAELYAPPAGMQGSTGPAAAEVRR